MAINKEELREALKALDPEELESIIGTKKKRRRGGGGRKKKNNNNKDIKNVNSNNDNDSDIIYTKSKEKKPQQNKRGRGNPTRRVPFERNPNRKIKNYDELITGSLSSKEKRELERAEKYDKLKKKSGIKINKNRKKYKMVKIECEECGVIDSVSPSLIRNDPDEGPRYKCNSCSTGGKNR